MARVVLPWVPLRLGGAVLALRETGAESGESSTAARPRGGDASLPLTLSAALQGLALRFCLCQAPSTGSLQCTQPLARAPCSLRGGTLSRPGAHFL